jgi:hypothetical protein
MAAAVKLKFRPLSMRETAQRLGVSRSRMEEISKIIDQVCKGSKKTKSKVVSRRSKAKSQR